MRLLLDTHIWIWSYSHPQKLTSEVARELSSSQNDRFLSPISIWEASLLLRKGKINLAHDFEQWFERSRDELVLQEAPLTWGVARQQRLTLANHGDPADRFLVATALVYGLTFVTADALLMNVPNLSILPNR
jgi:PIN domain nuclease of toxin-antitoxin system